MEVCAPRSARTKKRVYNASYHENRESPAGQAANEEAAGAKVNPFGLGRAPGPPWFYYLTLRGWPYLWWPCHWKGFLLLLAGILALVAGVLATIPFAMTHHIDGLPLLGGLLFYFPFWVVGIRHSQEF